MTARTIASVALLMLVLGACHTESPTAPAPTTASPPPFPYAPFAIRTDVAVPLQPPLAGAADFALEMSVDDRLSSDPDEAALYQKYRSRIAPEADRNEMRIPDAYVGTTGGALHRAVAARELPNDVVEVSICLYDTPGMYAMKKDGTLVKPAGGADALWRPLVKWTDQPAADGSQPAEPRWLLTESGVLNDLTADQVGAVCNPFKPDPFIQEPPQPTSTPPK